MNMPKLFKINEWKSSLNDDFVEFNDKVNWSPERSIERLWKTAYKVLYENDVKNWKITQEYAENNLQILNHIYGWVKHKFQNIDRNYWWRYFDHQIRIAYNILTKSTNPSLRKLFISLHHDSIEDTDIDFHTLETTINDEVWLWVLMISKKPFSEFIKNSKSDQVILNNEQINNIKKLWILNEEWNFLSKQYLEKKYIDKEKNSKEELLLEESWLNSLSDLEKLDIIDNIWILNRKKTLSDKFILKNDFEPEKVTLEEKFAVELYEKLNKKYKNHKNDHYFSKMKSNDEDKIIWNVFSDSPNLNKFYNHALFIMKKNKIKIDLKEVEKIVLDALEVKFWDRYDNLQTSEIYYEYNWDNLRKARRKIQETEKYFYDIALEFDNITWNNFSYLLTLEIGKLKWYINNKHQEHIQMHSKNSVSYLLDN